MKIRFSTKLCIIAILVILIFNMLFNTNIKARDNTAYVMSSKYYFGTDADNVVSRIPFWYRRVDYNVIAHQDPSKTDFWESLYADVQYLYGHGDWDRFWTKNVGLIVGNGRVYDGIHHFGTNDVHWDTDTILVVYAACLTSKDDNSNGLAAKTCERGADNVIGWRNKIWSDDCYSWGNNFSQGLALGYGVNDAANFANSKSYPGDDRQSEEEHSIKNWSQWSRGDANMKVGKFRTASNSIQKNIKESENSSAIQDNRNILRNTQETITFKGIEDIIDIIKKYDSSFNEENYIMSEAKGGRTINIINGEKDEQSIIELHLKIGEFYTNAGYVISIRDGIVEAIYDNTLPLKNKKEKISDKDFIISNELKSKQASYNEMAKNEVMQKLGSLDGIIEQKQTYYYDVENGQKYVRVRSVVENEEEKAKDYITSLFEI